MYPHTVLQEQIFSDIDARNSIENSIESQQSHRRTDVGNQLMIAGVVNELTILSVACYAAMVMSFLTIATHRRL